MTYANDTIAQLRQILAQHPSSAVWNEVTRTLEPWQGSPKETTLVLEYLQHHLTAWPDALLIAPTFWLKRLAAGQSEPFLQLVRSTDVPAGLMQMLPRSRFKKHKNQGFELLSTLSKLSGFHRSKEQQIAWMCRLTEAFVDNCVAVFQDAHIDTAMTFDTFAATADTKWPSLIASIMPQGRVKTRLESCLLNGWEPFCVWALANFLSKAMLQHTDAISASYHANLEAIFSAPEHKPLVDLSQAWITHIQSTLGENLEACCHVTLLCRRIRTMGAGDWTHGFLLKGPTKTALLCIWYPHLQELP